MKIRIREFILASVSIGIILVSSCLHPLQLNCHAQTREPFHQAVYDALQEYKHLGEQEMSKFPRLANKSKNEHSQESIVLEGLAQKAYLIGHIEEAEEKLASALSLSENQQTRQFYAAVLIEEKKYLEALPNCIDISLEHHKPDDHMEMPHLVEYDSLSHLMLAYVLVQIGENRASAFAYNMARKRVEIQFKNEISRIPLERREKEIARIPRLRYPLPPLSIDPDKAERKTLLEATRTLFQFADTAAYFGIGRLTPKMIDDAYEDNPGSAQITFYKALKTGATLEKGIRQRLVAEQACQPFYLKAAYLAGEKSTLGKLALECLKYAKEAEIETRKTIKDAEDQGYKID